jgi:hypothetical protein
MKLKYLAVLVFALLGLALAATQATAHRSDRSGHKFRTADFDRDWASNRCERQAGLNLNDRDSDDDGTIDGREDSDGDGADNAAESSLRSDCGEINKKLRIKHAVIASYSEADGLKLKVGRRGTVTAPLAADFVCKREVEDDNGDDDVVACTTADLVAGAEVRRARITDGSFSSIKLEEVDSTDDDDGNCGRDDRGERHHGNHRDDD